MSMMSIRAATPRDRAAIRSVEEHAFGQETEAGLVDALVAAGDAVVELVAEEEGQVVGHILFSRLHVMDGDRRFSAVALAPLAVEPSFHGTGIGGALVGEAHRRLKAAGETLSVVLGDPAYYGRFGFAVMEGFVSRYAGPYFQALMLAPDAPKAGRVSYPKAFDDLG
jgi:putative acetyltransferase